MSEETKYQRLAREFLLSIVEEADGDHYAPDFRDCLVDEIDWVTEKLADFLIEQEPLS